MFPPKSFSELLGFFSICCWVCAQLPQIIKNMKQRSCEGLALPFLFSWMLGDASNLIGCVLTHQLPFQTYLATYFCLSDCCLLAQYFYYGGGPKTPVTYLPPRSRRTSSAARLSFDASHYRTLSTTAGNITTTAALATHASDPHPELRRPRKYTGDFSDDAHATTPHLTEEPQDDAVLSPLSDSVHSEGGRRKRVSWSQERQEPSHGSSSRRHMSPIVPATSRHSATTLLARGRPPLREGETEAEAFPEQAAEAETRNASRASRRSAGMVLLGLGMLFGIGQFASGTRPLVGKGAKIGTVIVPGVDLGPSLAVELPVAGNIPGQFTDSPPIVVDVGLPTLPDDTPLDQLGQLNKGPTLERIIGRISAWLCTVLYLTSRLPQIWKNYVRKSVEGLSVYLFIAAFLGNFFYVWSLLTSAKAQLPPPASTQFFRESLPYLLGSGGTFVFDVTLVSQFFIYRGRHPRRSYIRSRGNSIVRSAALAEETAGLLRGDALPAARAHSDWAHVDTVAVPRSQSRG